MDYSAYNGGHMDVMMDGDDSGPKVVIREVRSAYISLYIASLD